MKYEKLVSEICGDNWTRASFEEQEGGYGVAMLMAFIEGATPSLPELAKALNIPISERVSKAYDRMVRSGLFSIGFNARKDKELNGIGFCSDRDGRIPTWSNKDASKSAWCQVAAVASGILYRYYGK
jgi:hypothetical protein